MDIQQAHAVVSGLWAADPSTDSATNPLLFVLGGLALVVVSALGPLSRLHERRQEVKRAHDDRRDQPT